MEVNGLQITFLEIPTRLTQEYNRWYDLDHMPEHISKADVIMGRRYVAQRDLHNIDGSETDEMFGGHPPYASIYFFGGPLDFMSDEARNGWTVMDHGIVRAGRYWKDGRATHTGWWRVGHATARPSVLVAEPAIPHLNHRGVIFAYGRAPSAERRQEAIDWWDKTHLVDLLAVPGVLAAIRCDPVNLDPEFVLHVILCEDHPAQVMAGIEKAKRYATAVGRWPAHGGVYESVAFMPYERIVPLEYDFDFGDDAP